MESYVALRHAILLCNWDQRTKMPQRGVLARAAATATLERLSQEFFASDATGRLLERASAEVAQAPVDSDDACLVRVTLHQWEKARRVPSGLRARRAEAASLGQTAWIRAREAQEFSIFAPRLKANIELAVEYAECHAGHAGFRCVYDVLLDDHEPGFSTATVSRLLNELRALTTRLVVNVGDHDPVIRPARQIRLSIQEQRQLVMSVLTLMGFDASAWRLDGAAHPFARKIGAGDIRIATRWDPDDWMFALYGAIHECGHGLYDAGISGALQATPLGMPESLGMAMHEAQSGLWANIVGRSRAFCELLASRLAMVLTRPAGLDPDALFADVNRVNLSPLRSAADETTYCLHIIFRTDLERQLLDGSLSVNDLPEAWRAQVATLLGVVVDDLSRGALQDVHWAAGMFGYFPTYALGALIAAQLWERARIELDMVDAQIAVGELRPLREWLTRSVHHHGAKFTSAELLGRVTARPLSVAPFSRYLGDKLRQVYNIAALADESTR